MNNTRKNGKKEGVLLLSDFHIIDPNQYTLDQSVILDDSFITNLAENAKKHSRNHNVVLKYIIILGDISYGSWNTEFEKAYTKINDLCKKLNIKKENVVIIPGNHDINRNDSAEHISDIGSDENAFKYQSPKFQKFKKFYDDFYQERDTEVEKFDPDKIIFRLIEAKEMNIVFLAINSNHKENHRDHVGEIDYKQLEDELETIRNQYPKRVIIALMHHRPKTFESGNVLQNWSDILSLFKQYKIETFFFGGYAKKNKGGIVESQSATWYVVSGSIYPKDKAASVSCMILEYVNGNIEKKFLTTSYKYVSSDEDKYWQSQDADPAIAKEFILETITGVEAVENQLEYVSDNNIDSEPTTQGESDKENKSEVIKFNYCDAIGKLSDEFQTAEDFVLDTIKENNLYLLGDFRWSPEGQSMSYIMMDYFFDNYNCYRNVKRCYQLLLNTFNDELLKKLFIDSNSEVYKKSAVAKTPNKETVSESEIIVRDINDGENIEDIELFPKQIIGYEMNGSMMGAFLAIRNRYDFTYLPADNRNHTDLEKSLPNNCDDYKHVIIVVDLIYTNALPKILVKRIKDNYKNVKIIQFISLIEGVKGKSRAVTNTDAWFTKDKKTLVVSNSVCKIPMLTGSLNMINDKFENNHVIPFYQLYSSKDAY